MHASVHSSSTASIRRPLWRDLLAAARLIGAVQGGQSLASALPQLAARHHWDAGERGAAQALAFATLRELGTARRQLQTLQRKPPPALLRDLLLVALTLLRPGQREAYAAHTVVDQAVEACKRSPELRHAAAFVNALLRRAASAPAPADTPGANHPGWWRDALQRAYPQDWADIMAVAQRPPSLILRVNLRRISRDDYLAALADAGLIGLAPADPTLDQAVVLRDAVGVDALPGFDQGWVSVQDAAAQRAAPLLAAQPGQRVLDACAAPGGKTAHILERTDCELLALDRDPQRLQRVDATLRRLGLHADLRAADAAQPAQWWDGRPFDRILLDAPCSASGIDRRHPDIRWLRRAEDIDTLAAEQRTLLDALWPLLAPGGRLVYATCSVFPQEGSEQARAIA